METRNLKSEKKISCFHNLLDFANILKAFVGTNYLTAAFAFKQAGFIFGVVGLVFIAAVTGHCCQLIVRCKHIIIDRTLEEHEDEAGDEDGDDDAAVLERRLMEELDYAGVARRALGTWAGRLVNLCVVITQTGFCIGYCVFIGNTLLTMWPKHALHSATTNVSAAGTPHATQHYMMHKRQIINETIYNASHVVHQQLSPTASGLINQNATTTTPTSPAIENTTTSAFLSITSSTAPENMSTPTPNTVNDRVSGAPALPWLVLAVLPLFLVFTLFRTVRQMGLVSVIANAAVMMGFVSIVIYLFIDFVPRGDVVLYRWRTLPVFFGMIVSAYEAIGTIIPIEAGMEGNQKKFPAFLNGSVALISLIIGLLGILGYLRYGETTEQILSHNLPQAGLLYLLVNGTLLVGVACTYPLQVYPVVELLEPQLFAPGKVCGSPENLEDSFRMDESQVSLLDSKEPLASQEKLAKVPTWRRNVVRCVLATAIVGAAILLRNVFAYISAFTGAIGSCPLVFIIPPLLHYKLQRYEVSGIYLAKDVFIVFLGIIFTIISTITVAQELIERV